MRRIETSTLSNQSLATALLCHTYTADADRLIFVRVFGDQLAGNGDYVAYLTVQRLGAGSAYRVVPTTTAAVASGVTAAMLTTIGVPVKSTDVVKVYLTGLAGDTTTPDVITEIWEDELHITVGAAGAGLTAAAGLAAADITTLLSRLSAARAGYLDNLSAGAVALASALTTAQVDLTTLLSRVTGAVALATSTTAAAIRAALGMAAADLDAQLDAIGGAGNPWDLDIEGETFDDGTAGDILQGLAGGTVYAIGSTPNTDAALSIRNADTVAVTIGDLTGLAAGWDSLIVTIKKGKHDPDSAAILQVRVNVATPTLPGIVYINGQGPVAAGVLATDAWISDVDAGADTLVLNIKPAASVLLPVRGALWWNVKQLDGTTWTSLATGEESAEITPGITQAIS